MKKNIGFIVGATTFALFMTEAVIHFNMGQNYKKHKNEKKSTFELPNRDELIKLSLIVGTFSVLNGYLVNKIKESL